MYTDNWRLRPANKRTPSEILSEPAKSGSTFHCGSKLIRIPAQALDAIFTPVPNSNSWVS